MIIYIILLSLVQCSHPHILRYCCSVMGKSGNSDAKELLMITELCSGKGEGGVVLLRI